MICPILRIANNVFSCAKNDRFNQKPQILVREFLAKIPAFYRPLQLCGAPCSGASQAVNKKSFSRRVFLVKKVKNISEIGVE